MKTLKNTGCFLRKVSRNWKKNATTFCIISVTSMYVGRHLQYLLLININYYPV